MPQLIARILSSASHLLYYARVFDASECSQPPSRDDYTFGRFVEVRVPEATGGDGEERILALIVNSQLLSPDGPNSGPRLTVPHTHNAVFAPDYLVETGVLLSLLLVGTVGEKDSHQGVPRYVLPVGSDVYAAQDADIRRFHLDEKGRFQLRYYPLLREAGKAFEAALLEQIRLQVEPLCGEQAQRILRILQKNMAWEMAAAPMART